VYSVYLGCARNVNGRKNKYLFVDISRPLYELILFINLHFFFQYASPFKEETELFMTVPE